MYFEKIKINDFRALKNQTIQLGKYLTVLSGFNATGKSTVLGLLGNSSELKVKEGRPINSPQFSADFKDLFIGSVLHDRSGSDKFEIFMNDGTQIVDSRKYRITWQNQGTRFRIIPYKINPETKRKINDAKFKYPVLYLGLSRLYPLGELKPNKFSKRKITLSDEESQWYKQQHTNILSLRDENILQYDDIALPSISSRHKISTVTDTYDSNANSAGQDNLGQILLSIMSFRRLRQQGKFTDGGLLLIDEVDAALHPIAQIRLIELLIQTARELKIQVVVSTHSLTILEKICPKAENDTNQNIQVVYFDNSNRLLNIKNNIPYNDIKNNLLIQVNNCKEFKINVYCEDKEAQWMVKNIAPEMVEKLDFKDVSFSCTQLIDLLNADPEYFSRSIVVFDGDVRNSQLEKINPVLRKNQTFIVLPSTNLDTTPQDELLNPELELYNYIKNIEATHPYWVNNDTEFSYRYISENGPDSKRYENHEKKRDRSKKWFNEHLSYIESTCVIQYWVKDHEDKVSEFRQKLGEIINKISRKLMI